jgi:S-DNA-T family DNA segregation ATPase FtsK/SpoIIIE
MNPFAAVLKPTRSRRLNELVGITFMACGLLLLLALASYHPSDPSLNTAAPHGAHPQNWIGLVGSYSSDLLLQLLGVTVFCIPIFLGGLGWAWIKSRTILTPWAKWTGVCLWFIAAPAALALLPWGWKLRHAVPIEGITGRLLADTFIHYMNSTGATVTILVLAAIAVYLTTAFSFSRARQWFAVNFAFFFAWSDRYRHWRANRAAAREERNATRTRDKYARELERAKHRAAMAQASANELPPAPANQSSQEDLPEEPLPVERRGSVWNSMPRAQVPVRRAPEPAPVTAVVPPPVPPSRPQFAAELPLAPAPAAYAPPPMPPATPPPAQAPAAFSIGTRADASQQSVTVTPRSLSGYKLPPSTLLQRSDDSLTVQEDELREQARLLIEKCDEFGVHGQITHINPGPVVTTYEFKPEAGVKYSRILGLEQDLCLAMSAQSILIERMAGKSTVGIQVPNLERETIWFRDVVESEPFANSRSRLTMALGKDINGRIQTADLAAMPHILIAGSTGSGKSVAINAMIMSLLYKATPAQVRLILVDPKRVELGMYEGIPHLFTPIIAEPKLAANALRNAVREMERRLKLLAAHKKKHIIDYNAMFDGQSPSLFDEDTADEPLPYIVIIIDELADLMMLDKANVEESITRIAQMARAVGIHLILATQRPSVDVITGLIKANVPTRMSFRLTTKTDSRTILDSNGAEALLGRGDMLFLPPGSSRLQRLHAPFVTEKEITAVVDFWKEQGEAQYVQGFTEAPAGDKSRGDDAEGEDGEHDEAFEDAVRLVLEFGKASTSLLQRRLRIGYGRAAHLIDLMERDGIVGPADGSKPREILKPPDWLREVEPAMR